MSGNSKDRRVARTRAALHRALAQLIHEKPYDDIGVGDIAKRANVGRTTFYAHFQGKDELLVSGIEELLASRPRPPEGIERIVGFARPVLEHVRHVRSAHGGLASAGTREHVHARLRNALIGAIESDVRASCTGPAVHLLAAFVAGTFVLVLEETVAAGGASADRADEVFRALVVPSLRASLRPSAPRA